MTRTLAADPGAVREALTDLEPFMAAAGFDEVTVDGDTVRVRNRVGIVDIELTLERVDAPDADWRTSSARASSTRCGRRTWFRRSPTGAR